MKHKISHVENTATLKNFQGATAAPPSSQKAAIEFYSVGGAVRDALLGLPVHDRDFLVVGATPEDMIARGFTPKNKEGLTFIHPTTQDEYTLAISDKKRAPGYDGYEYHIAAELVLKDTLIRRDLTINAVAQAADGAIVDPFDGQKDLRDRIFRHVSPAFADDPMHIFQLARLAGRFPEFTVAEETAALMHQMVENGEVASLAPPRIWRELACGLMETKPSRMFEVLRQCGALVHIFPELDVLWGVPQLEKYHPETDTGRHVMMALDCVSRRNHTLPIRFASLTHDLGKGGTPREAWPHHEAHEARSERLIEKICLRMKIPDDCRILALATARGHMDVSRALSLRADSVVALFERCDAFSNPQLFIDMLHASECDHHGHTGIASAPFAQAAYLQSALTVAQGVNADPIALEYPGRRRHFLAALHKARVSAVRANNLISR